MTDDTGGRPVSRKTKESADTIALDRCFRNSVIKEAFGHPVLNIGARSLTLLVRVL